MTRIRLSVHARRGVCNRSARGLPPLRSSPAWVFSPPARNTLATPGYCYAVSPAMKVFLDRFSDLLELPDLALRGHPIKARTEDFSASVK
jgi:hypothetical protein